MKPDNTEQRSPATAQIQVDSERMVITKWSFAPGEQTGWHRHMLDYAVVPLTNGMLLIEAIGGNQLASRYKGSLARTGRTASEDCERFGELHLMLRAFIRNATVLSLGRTHGEAAGGDDHHLRGAVDVAEAVARLETFVAG